MPEPKTYIADPREAAADYQEAKMNNHGPTDKNGNCTLCGKNISTGADWTAEAGRPCVGREAKMSDEPKIQRFRVRPTGKHSWEKEFCEDGGNVSFLDVEPYVAAKVEQARREERGRCRREYEPLRVAARDVIETRSGALLAMREALSIVETVRRRLP